MAAVVKPKSSPGCGFTFLALFALAGAALLVAAVRGYRRGDDWRAMLAMGGTGVVFVAAGVGFGAEMRGAETQRRETEKRWAQFPSEPWKWNPRWSERGIAADTSQGAGATWFFAILWNGISVPAAIGATQKIAAGEKFLVVVYVFPLIGAAILWTAIYRTLQARKFGRAVFVPASLPGEIGGTLGGVIHVPRRVEIEADARLALRCVHRSATGAGDNRTVRESVLWERSVRIAREKWRTSENGTEIPVLLPVAGNCAPTEMSDDRDNRVLWRLAIAAKAAGVDFDASFEVPVFATGRGQPGALPEEPLLEEYRAELLSDGDLAAAGIRREPDGLVFTSAHLRGMRLATASIALGMSALEIYLFMVSSPWILRLVMGLFAAIGLLFAHGAWMGDTSLRVSGEIAIVSGRRLMGTKEVRVRRADAAEVRSAESMGVGEQKYYRLKLIGVNGADPTQISAGEPFAARKLRFQLRQTLKELGASDPAQAGGRAREILEQLQRTPKFEIEFASNVPGLATAQAVAERVLGMIRG